MKTKQLFGLIMVLGCSIAVSFAQKHQRGGGTLDDRINRRLDKMDQIVKFTGNQRKDMLTFMVDLAKKKKDAFCANEIGSDGMKNAMKAINKERREGVKKALNSDQFKLWKDYVKTQKRELKNNNRGKGLQDNQDEK